MLKDLEDKSTAYYDAKKDVFASCKSAKLNISAVTTFQCKLKWGKPNGNKVSFRYSDRVKNKALWRGNINQCKHCNNKHGDNEMCERNPEYKKFTSNHIKHVSQKSSRYTNRWKCVVKRLSTIFWCVRVEVKQFANFSCVVDSDKSCETTDSETLYDPETCSRIYWYLIHPELLCL
ncbi:hypothetical protein BsWGS_15927 [Bradybaena similaris]